MAFIHSQYVTGRKVVTLVNVIVYKDQNIYSVFSLCASVPIEELTVALSSAYQLSVLVEELVASLSSAIGILTYMSTLKLTASSTSVYSLSTAVT